MVWKEEKEEEEIAFGGKRLSGNHKSHAAFEISLPLGGFSSHCCPRKYKDYFLEMEDEEGR